MNNTIEQMPSSPANNSPLANWSDEDLLLEYRSTGDRRMFDELVHRYERELYNYLRQYLGDAQMAEDTFQATFLQVHLKCDRFEEGRKLKPWLYTVATNQAIDAQRRNRRHRVVSLDRTYDVGGDGSEAGSLVDLLDGGTLGPEEQAEATEEGEKVRLAVDQLPESMQQVLTLVYYQGMKYREAADVLDIPVGTVKSRLHAAVHKLNQMLPDPEPEDHVIPPQAN